MTVITLRYVNQPKNPTGKMGSIVGNDGTRYMVPVENLGKFAVGGTYEVAVAQETWKPGEPALMVIRGVPAQTGAAPAISGPYPTTPTHASGHVNGAKIGESAARQIFVTGIVGRAMGSGKFSPSDLEALTSAAIAAYDKHLG